MEKWLKTVFKAGLIGCAFFQSTVAEPVKAEIKIQETFGFDQGSGKTAPSELGDYQLTQSSLRLKAGHSYGSWSWDMHTLFGANYSRQLQSISSVLPNYPAKALFDLDTIISDGEEGEFALRMDRASLNYTANQYAVKIGRQALTWGNGKLFNPMDLFDPFSPQAQDTSYKPGADMIYFQSLFDSGADLQVLYLPRKNVSANRISEDLSSYAAKYLFYRESWQFEIMVAEDWDDEISAVSVVGSLGSALWSTDFVYTQLTEGGDSTSLTTNLQHAWTWNSKPITGFVEYAHNGLGANDVSGLSAIPSELSSRIARGQLYNTGRDYLGLGVSVQWNPLTTISPSLILNMYDRSGIALISAVWNAGENDNLILGLQAPFGSEDSEYGNPANPTQLYLRWEKYF